MEINQFIINNLDDKIEDGVLNPENYRFASFYPAPVCFYLREELERAGVKIEKEEINRRCKHRLFKDGKQDWIVDGEKIVLIIEFEPIVHEGKKIDGFVAPKFIMPLKDKIAGEK